MPVSAGLRAFFAKLAKSGTIKRYAPRVASGVVSTGRKLWNNQKFARKVAFRTDLASAGVGVGLTLYGLDYVRKDKAHVRKMQQRREKAVQRFESGLMATPPTQLLRRSAKIRRVGEK